MDSSTEILVTSAATLCAVYTLSGNRRLNKLPGPRTIPLFGNALQLDKNKPHQTLSKWADQYGDIYKMNLFGEDIVVVNSYEGITEMMLTRSNDYAGRPESYRIKCFFHDQDLAFYDMDPTRSVMKKLCSKGLKQVGEQLTELEEILSEFTDELTEHLTSHSGKPFDIRMDIRSTVARITGTLTYGRALTKEEHAEFVRVAEDVNESITPGADNAVLDFLPWVRNPLFRLYNDIKAKAKRSDKLYMTQLNKTIESYQGEVRCALDELIQELQQPSLVKTNPLNIELVCGIGMDLAIGGIVTTSSVLYGFVSLIVANPVIQQEAYEHIIKAIGDRPPTLQDRAAIPLIEAMILELMRLMSVTPVAAPHKALVDSTLLGYEIPKGTQVWPNLWYLHHDPKLWDDPWSFKPRRYLDSKGMLLAADHPLRKQFFAFGAGRRVCVGAAMAKNRMFIIIVTLLQRFEFVRPAGENIITDPRKFKLGLVIKPDDFKVIVKPR